MSEHETSIGLSEEAIALARRLERVLARVEAAFPPAPAPTDWSAYAFRWRKPGRLIAVDCPARQDADNLLHIDRQKALLDRNTQQFLDGFPANNALLWGPRGTGKSSLVRALLSRYATEGLRLIEVDAHDLVDLPDIALHIRERPERFIVFADDLSFEANDPSYKALKAMLDGSVCASPDNLLVYATSNRRHLMPEFMQENLEARSLGGEIHHAESVEEKISLSERFGLWIAFHPFDQDAYLDMVRRWLEVLGVPPQGDHWRATALRFALARGSRSGRIAVQFARDFAGSTKLQESRGVE